MSWTRASSALLALLLAWSGCSSDHRAPKREAYGHPQPVYGGTFLFANDDDIRTLDPAIGYDSTSWTAMYLVFEALLDYDDDMELMGRLAERWEVEDRTWTFHLRQGVQFHNGREMVADDVVKSWTRLLQPGLGSPGADFFQIIDGARAVLAGEAEQVRGLRALDRYTVQVTLERPDATFANVVAMNFGAIYPMEEVERLGERWPYAPVGTGPFKVQEWLLGEKTVFVRHEDYWDPALPYLDAIVHYAHVPRELQFLRMEADELHQVHRLTSPDYLWIKRNPHWSVQLEEVAQADTYGEMLNTEMPPFDDVWFRRAVSTAIDREKLAKLRNGRAKPSISWVPPGLAAHVTWEDLTPEEREAYKWQRYDPELAREALAKAGYPDGYTGRPIPYWTLTSESSLVTALSIQQDLAEVGIPIAIHNVTFPAYLTATGRRNTVPMGYVGWAMDYPDPRNFLETKFHCRMRSDENSNNDSFYCNPEVDRLFDEAATELDPERRGQLYRRAQTLIAADVPYVFEYHTISQSVVQPYVKGFRQHPVHNRDMSQVWLDLPGGRPSP